jgi:hypothetical protein
MTPSSRARWFLLEQFSTEVKRLNEETYIFINSRGFGWKKRDTRSWWPVITTWYLNVTRFFWNKLQGEKASW